MASILDYPLTILVSLALGLKAAEGFISDLIKDYYLENTRIYLTNSSAKNFEYLFFSGLPLSIGYYLNHILKLINQGETSYDRTSLIVSVLEKAYFLSLGLIANKIFYGNSNPGSPKFMLGLFRIYLGHKFLRGIYSEESLKGEYFYSILPLLVAPLGYIILNNKSYNQLFLLTPLLNKTVSNVGQVSYNLNGSKLFLIDNLKFFLMLFLLYFLFLKILSVFKKNSFFNSGKGGLPQRYRLQFLALTSSLFSLYLVGNVLVLKVILSIFSRLNLLIDKEFAVSLVGPSMYLLNEIENSLLLIPELTNVAFNYWIALVPGYFISELLNFYKIYLEPHFNLKVRSYLILNLVADVILYPVLTILGLIPVVVLRATQYKSLLEFFKEVLEVTLLRPLKGFNYYYWGVPGWNFINIGVIGYLFFLILEFIVAMMDELMVPLVISVISEVPNSEITNQEKQLLTLKLSWFRRILLFLNLGLPTGLEIRGERYNFFGVLVFTILEKYFSKAF